MTQDKLSPKYSGRFTYIPTLVELYGGDEYLDEELISTI